MSQSLSVDQLGVSSGERTWTRHLPIAFVLLGGLAMMLLKHEYGDAMISDASLMMIALAFYLIAAIFQLTNLYAPSAMAERIGFWGAVLGVFCNWSAWMVRWVAAYDREISILRENGNPETPWFFRYVPFANLYDLSLAFAFGAGITTLALAYRKNFQFMAAFTLPLAALILVLARFIGSEFIDLPPVLDSYWRPIHVGVASLSYGIALVCFAVAVIYLLKDRAKVEAMGIWSSVFALGVIGTVSGFSVLTQGVYRIGTFLPNMNGGKPFSGFFRFELPWVGPSLVLAAVLLLGVIVAFSLFVFQGSEPARRAGHVLLKASLAVQILSIALLVMGVRNAGPIQPALAAQLAREPQQFIAVGRELASKEDMSASEFAALTNSQFEAAGRQFFQNAGDRLFLGFNTNPVELAGLITALAGTFFVALFSFRTDHLRERLPELEALDKMMYKTACLAFAGLAMLLITGAIWANESWGRPWGFDSKETGALVAWLTYAAFLHTRISRGWTGRSSAYFAILGFLLVIFTYLGVSYLLPGLHSYA